MLKNLLKLVVLLVIVAVGLFAYGKYAPTSRMGIALNRLQRTLPQLIANGHVRTSDLTEIGKDAFGQTDRDIEKQNGKAIVYKWRDAEGNWTYGNAPPPGVKAVPQEIDLSKTNRLSQ